MHTNRFNGDPPYANQATATLEPSNDSFLLINATVRVAQRLWRDGFRYAKAGVVFVDLCRKDRATTQFFPSRDPVRSAALMQALDAVNRRYGSDTLRPGGTGARPGWSMRRAKLSPAYTTCFEDLLRSMLILLATMAGRQSGQAQVQVVPVLAGAVLQNSPELRFLWFVVRMCRAEHLSSRIRAGPDRDGVKMVTLRPGPLMQVSITLASLRVGGCCAGGGEFEPRSGRGMVASVLNRTGIEPTPERGKRTRAAAPRDDAGSTL